MNVTSGRGALMLTICVQLSTLPESKLGQFLHQRLPKQSSSDHNSVND